MYAAVCPQISSLSSDHLGPCLLKIGYLWEIDPVLRRAGYAVSVSICVAILCLAPRLPGPVGAAVGSVLLICFFVCRKWLVRWVLMRVLPSRTSAVIRNGVNDYGNVPVCGQCGYDLRGKASDRCPECGLFLYTGAADPKASAPDP